MRGQRGRLPVQALGYVNSTKVILGLPETAEDKHWYSFMPTAFLFQRGCGSLGASTDKTYFHADRLFNSQING